MVETEKQKETPLLEQKEQKKVEKKTLVVKPKKQPSKNVQQKKLPASQKGMKEGWVRNTTVMRKDHLKKLKALAFLNDKPIKDILDEALTQYLKDKKIPKILLKHETQPKIEK